MDSDEQERYVHGGEFVELLKAYTDAVILLQTFASPQQRRATQDIDNGQAGVFLHVQ